MVINYRDEEVFPLVEAPDHVPRRQGRKVAKSTLFRWATRGVRGVRLETLMVGGTLHTSAGALQRFFERTTAAAEEERGRQRAKTAERSIARVAKAEAELTELGL